MASLRVILLLLLVTSGSLASPQWQRQSSLPNLSSPLSMGMKFLDNLRTGMTRTIGRIFGSGQQGKENQQGRPVRQRLTPPPAAPTVPVHNLGGAVPQVHNVGGGVPVHHGGTEAPSSFFTVLHETQSSSTPFPDTSGFTDESFKPIDFFTGDNPFQGNVEEETLPFVQNGDSFVQSGGPVQNSNSFTHNGGSFVQNSEPFVQNHEHSVQNHGSFVQNGENSHSQVIGEGEKEGPSFAVFQDGNQQQPSQGGTFQAFPPNPAFGNVGSSIPFGNTNHFSLGTGFIDTPGQLPLAPRPTFEDIQVREDQPQVSQHVQSGDQRQVFLTSRADHPKPKPHNFQKVTTQQGPNTKQTKNPSPVTKATSSSHLSSKPITTPITTKATTFKVHNTRNEPIPQRITPEYSGFTERPVTQAKPSRHINTGIKMKLSPKPGDGENEDTEVSSYEFGYGVLDNDTGNQFYHAEKREEGLTKGSYKIQLPDGRVQTVTYLADNQGFHPKITYQGEAQYPIEQSNKKPSAVPQN